jgi:hypothetical protein
MAMHEMRPEMGRRPTGDGCGVHRLRAEPPIILVSVEGHCPARAASFAIELPLAADVERATVLTKTL